MVGHFSLLLLYFLNRLCKISLCCWRGILLGYLEQAPQHRVFFLQLAHDKLSLLLQVRLLIHGKPYDSVHCQHFLAKLHAMLDCFIPFGGDFGQALLCIVEEGNFGMFARELLLELLVLL